MATSNLTLTITIEHTANINTAQEIAALVAAHVASTQVGVDKPPTTFGRSTFVGGEEGSGQPGVHVFLQSAAVTTVKQ